MSKKKVKYIKMYVDGKEEEAFAQALKDVWDGNKLDEVKKVYVLIQVLASVTVGSVPDMEDGTIDMQELYRRGSGVVDALHAEMLNMAGEEPIELH